MMIDPIATHSRTKPDRLACVDLDSARRWTWRNLDLVINEIGNQLVETLGPASGSRVATLARNSVDMLILQFACVRAGAIFVPFNWRLAPPEIAVLIEDAAPALLFRDADFVAPVFSGPTYILADLTAFAPGQNSQSLISARRDWEAPSTLLYTSGTSGRPKGVMVSEANAFWGSTNFIHGNDVSADSVFLCDMPLFHTAGLFANARTPILAGATLLVSRGFDAAVTLARLADPALGITHYFSVPQMAQVMWNQPGFSPKMLTGLSVYAMGGAPNPAAQIERFLRAGVAMSDGFGMSETCSNFGMPVGDRALLIEKAGSCGLPYLSIQTRIVDEADNEVPDGTTGELWLKGPSVTQGYWNQPEKTEASFHNGWFKTGDAAIRDSDGFFYLVDRKKDMFISGGENVYPAEVEAAVAEMDIVAECAVVGIVDETWGEVGWAYVIPPPGKSVTPDAVIAHCKSRLAGFKVPKAVIVTDVIPRTASGKVQKHVLKEQALVAASIANGGK
jgi:fatty-acyl-CoA synthase